MDGDYRNNRTLQKHANCLEIRVLFNLWQPIIRQFAETSRKRWPEYLSVVSLVKSARLFGVWNMRLRVNDRTKASVLKKSIRKLRQ